MIFSFSVKELYLHTVFLSTLSIVRGCISINGFTNTALYGDNRLWLADVTLIFDGTPQIKVQRYQIASPRWTNDISSAKKKTEVLFAKKYVQY